MKLLFTFALLFVSSYLFCQLPDCDIWLLDIKDSVGRISFHNPINITNRKGYDNQPTFSPDGKYILFSSQHDSAGQTDIYKYDLATKEITQFTHTPTSEYSPTFMPDGKNISVVMVEKDSAQRLWRFPLSPLEGGDTECGGCACIMKNIDSVGYHCWINKDSVAVFILTKPSFTLQVADIHSQKTIMISDSIGRCMRMKEGKLWFTTKTDHFNSVNEHNFKTKQITTKGAIVSEDYCFYGKNGIWSCSGNTIIAGYINNKQGADEIANLKSYGITKITRIAISPDRKRIALVSNK